MAKISISVPEQIRLGNLDIYEQDLNVLQKIKAWFGDYALYYKFKWGLR